MPAAKTQAPKATPPKQPTEADVVLLIVAQSAELAVRDVYNDAVAAETFSDVQLSVLETFRGHHTAYAQSLNGLLGKVATNARNESLYTSYSSQLTSTAASLLALQSLENILVATHTEIVGALEGLAGANLMASIVMVEARHAAVFGSAPELDIAAALNDVAESLVTPTTIEG